MDLQDNIKYTYSLLGTYTNRYITQVCLVHNNGHFMYICIENIQLSTGYSMQSRNRRTVLSTKSEQPKEIFNFFECCRICKKYYHSSQTKNRLYIHLHISFN